jgi:hypothetical protein
MNEMEMLAELGADTPLPALDELSGVRARVLASVAAETAAGRRARSRRVLVRRLVIGGVAAAAAVAAVAAVVLVPGARSGQAPVRADLTVKQVLVRAATAALSQTAVTPQPDQFVYAEVKVSGTGVTQSWDSVNGERDFRIVTSGYSDGGGTTTVPGCVNGHRELPAIERVVTKGGRKHPSVRSTLVPCTPQPAYFPDMPTSASAMGAFLEQYHRTNHGDPNSLAGDAGGMLESDYMLPAQRAALYKYLSSAPGLIVFPSLPDASGRTGVGIGWTVGHVKTVLIFDSGTSTLLGIDTLNQQGKLIGGESLLVPPTIVSQLGQLP